MNTPNNLQQKAYLSLVAILCDADKPNKDIHRNGITIQELERLYQLYMVGPVAAC